MREFNQNSHAERPAEQAGYAAWIALGAMAAGSIGAIVGLAHCSRSRRSSAVFDEPADPMTITAPHGDKLKSAVV